MPKPKRKCRRRGCSWPRARPKLASDESTYAASRPRPARREWSPGNELDVAARAVEADRAQVSAQRAGRLRRHAGARVDRARSRIPGCAGAVRWRRHGAQRASGRAGRRGSGGAEPLVRIEAQSKLRLVVPVPDTYAAVIRGARRVEFSVSSYPGRTFSGQRSLGSPTRSIRGPERWPWNRGGKR